MRIIVHLDLQGRYSEKLTCSRHKQSGCEPLARQGKRREAAEGRAAGRADSPRDCAPHARPQLGAVGEVGDAGTEEGPTESETEPSKHLRKYRDTLRKTAQGANNTASSV